MSNFSGQLISGSYTNILNIGTGAGNHCLPSNGRVNITDSAGNSSSISIGGSSQGLSVTGNIISDNNICGVTGCFTGDLGVDLHATMKTACIAEAAGVGGDLTVTGNFDTTNSKFTVDSACTITTNNTCVGGTLTVGGNTAVTGCITATADIIAYSSSDKRFKDDLNKICNTKDILNGLTGYSFKWNETSGREGTDLGVIAQDVKEVLPQIVQEREDGYLAVDYPKLIPVLIEEVKRLSDEVDKLKSIQTF
tara:strand:+ start:9963 stop:10715 length:753 start_codon:yes stop_codon:yes gene_type:complete